jgi:hypothetical protein
MARVVGGTDLPSLTIGAQPVVGFSSAQWESLFDTAGYPHTSQLPRSYKYAAATPLIAPNAPATASAPPPAPPSAANLPPPSGPTADNPSGIKF